jgi:hypothetical protein
MDYFKENKKIVKENVRVSSPLDLNNLSEEKIIF